MPNSRTAGVRTVEREECAPQVPKRYESKRSHGQVFVTVNGQALDPRFDLHFHSPDGFEWGYGGSGPAQLALALLADCLNDDQQALTHYQDFKRMIVAGLPRDGWTLTDAEIQQAMQSRLANQKGERPA